MPVVEPCAPMSPWPTIGWRTAVYATLAPDMTQDEEPLHWTAEWLAFLFENMTVIGVTGVAVIAFLYALRNRRYNRPALTGMEVLHQSLAVIAPSTAAPPPCCAIVGSECPREGSVWCFHASQYWAALALCASFWLAACTSAAGGAPHEHHHQRRELRSAGRDPALLRKGHRNRRAGRGRGQRTRACQLRERRRRCGPHARS